MRGRSLSIGEAKVPELPAESVSPGGAAVIVHGASAAAAAFKSLPDRSPIE